MKRLAAKGVIRSRRYSEHPPRVEYELTQKGEDLRPICGRWSSGAFGTRAVALPRRSQGEILSAHPRAYSGERTYLLFQNLHRYTLSGAVFLLGCLWWEGLAAFFRNGQFGIGVGTIVMVINAALLTGYTFGCHSWRHLIGGRHDCFTCEQRPTTSFKLWQGSTWLNERHMAFAWFSLVWVAFTDFYIYLVSSGTITDLNTW